MSAMQGAVMEKTLVDLRDDDFGGDEALPREPKVGVTI
jgi:hypothetical protein